ncbi:gliding motility-associated C-terminal domain-containing protein [Flavobacterium humidisoli]|uniref:Gliding motility-associated C-terminal domain-containing protein n=1 Tax=Flavobacterium humidisoli TaxID=2937442 RepID=A0ABY4LQF8_9FLAO|nr:gliding motility-associated C-terminal domain-containing protein [Flavobacterium humidisoli]UPZ15152.1 gliding motility-associated C-terminal domain-containing protein [Flavobacterium humidisoli]
MKSKITLVVMLIMLPVMNFMGNIAFAQTVSGTASNTGCISSGSVNASSTGLGSTPQYQLLRSGVVVAPVPGDGTQFTNDPVFTGLITGSYVVNARASTGGTVYSSTTIAVTDGYTPMVVTTPTKVAGCVGGNAVLTATVTAGKTPFTYTIATQAAPGTILQSSGSITANSFTFNALPANSYIISVTDDCGQTITGATSITNPTLGLNDIKLGYIAYPGYSTEYNCGAGLYVTNSANFRYVATNTILSAADAANFTWKIKYQGLLYGKDIDADGFSDVGGAGYPSTQTKIGLPAIATRDGVIADIANMKAVLIDNCGNTKEFPVQILYNTIAATNCANSGLVRMGPSSLACIPINVTFTNIANSADVVLKTVTAPVNNFTGFTTGATYHVTYTDAEGNTTGDFSLPVSQNITIPAAPNITLFQYASARNMNVVGYGTLSVNVSPFQTGDVIGFTVTSSNNSLVPVGYSGNVPLDGGGYANFPKVNATDPTANWPKGNYTLDITTPCGTKSINVTVAGFAATLSANYTTTPVCGGFNYVMNGTFDDPPSYQVVIISGPSSVGQTRDLASTTASLPFNGLGYGTYVFALRSKGGTQNFFTQTVTFDANNAIIVDKTNTGGYVCASGATNGVLTITATSISPPPGNVLQYALSTDGGTNYGPYQNGNTFSGLTDNIYFFRVKDDCGNIITQSAQIGVAAAPTITADGIATPATVCNVGSGTIQLDVDVLGAVSYLWAGPGINASNENVKDPVINFADLLVGANNITATVTFGAPCSSSTVSNLTINVNPLPTIAITNPAGVCAPNSVDITSAAITAGSDAGLTYTYFSDDIGTVPIADPAAITIADTYYIKGTNANGCSSISPVVVTINALPTASINYLATPYCKTGTAAVEEIGVAGGIYSSDPDLIINAATGEIDLAASTVGDHTVTYTFNDGSCSNTTTALITINALPIATISYPNALYCQAGTAVSTETGILGGVYSGDAGLSIDEITGAIDLAGSTTGNHTVTYFFSDGTCSNSTTASIVINPVVLPSPLSNINAQCEATPTAPTLTDICAGTITAATSTVFPITTQGTTVVTWTFDYGNGYTQSVNQNVIIEDTFSPVMPILLDVTGQCEATPTVPIASDACTGAITGVTTTPFPITAKGTTIVLWTFDDGNGNTSFANQNVIITDTTAPKAPVLTDLTGECSVIPTAPTTVDNCDSATIIGTTSTSFPITAQGTTTVTWNFTDSSGNTVTVNQNVIIDDLTPPTVPVLADVKGECAATPAVPTAVDACSGTITGTTSTSFPITAQGITAVTWTFDDGNGNIATAVQNVIIEDTFSPVMPILLDVTGQCEATPTVPIASDACTGAITGVTTTPFPITAKGTTIVLWTFDDGNGNTSFANQNVIITDTTAPTAPVLTDLTGECSVIPTAPTTVDNCDSATIIGTTSTSFPITAQGTTTVTWNFTDSSGNTVTVNQNVIIDDLTPPTVPVLADVKGECAATPAVPTAVDACSGTITGTTSTSFPITAQGITAVTWTFDDGNGNISTALQNVIIDDITPPVVPVLADVKGECAATPAVPTAVDACSGTITGTTSTSFPITAQGTTVVTWSFDDGNGNIATVNQNVIIDDITPPVVPVLADITGQCSVTPAVPTTTDACSGLITGTTTVAFPITAVGTTIVTWTFNDANGNSVTANQNVVISQIALVGTEAAVCSTANAGYTITLSVNGQEPYTASGTGAPGTWSGNTWTSGLISAATNYSVNLQDASACNTVTVAGVSPNCCSFNVTCPTFQPLTVSCYDEVPSQVSLTEVQFEALGNGDGQIAETNCGVIEITAANSPDPGCNANVTRTYTVTEYDDANRNGLRDAGENTILNTAICTQIIQVHDTIAPVFAETPPTAVINADCDTIPSAPAFTATDNCGSAAVSYDETRVDGDCSSRYTLIRTWTASDQCGNQNSLVQTINVSCVEEIYNAISPNGDGLNDSLFIKGIDCYPDNVVKIYNRYGVIVYEKNGYDNVTSPFEGFSDGRATVARGNKLPTGTYFYTLEYDSNGRKIEKAGYLYVSSQ